MSLISEIESFFGITATVATIVTDFAEEEKVVITGLTGISALITAGATVTDAVSSELETLLPSIKTAIADVDAKVDGAAAKAKTVIAEAQAFLAARSITPTTSEAATADRAPAASFHIA